MAITFGGLATGLDTNTIVSELMALERRPLQTLEIKPGLKNERLHTQVLIPPWTVFSQKLRI